jgi:hypothetical protein
MPTLEALTTLLLQHETRMQFHQSSIRGNSGQVEALAAHFQRQNFTKGPSSFRPQQSGSHLAQRTPFQQHPRPYTQGLRCCSWCGAPGHLLRECNEFAQEVAKRARDCRMGGRTTNPPLIHSNLVLQDAEEENQYSDEPIETFDAALGGVGLDQDSSWILDSGCSRHVSGNPEAFNSLDFHRSPAMVQTAGNQLLPIEGKGSVNLGNNSEIKIDDVYFVPGLSFNLLSVGSITDMGLTLVFDDQGCIVYKGSEVVGCGTRDPRPGLYRYIIDDPKFKICAVASAPVAHLWHGRLGHLNMHNLHAMGAHNLATGVPLISSRHDLCDSCSAGKQAREPAPKAATRPRASRALQLVHSDLCGKIKPTSLGGSEYFITFTDDFSRYTWIYFMRAKSDALRFFQQFKAAVELALSAKIEALRSDNGGEYLSLAFTHNIRRHSIPFRTLR